MPEKYHSFNISARLGLLKFICKVFYLGLEPKQSFCFVPRMGLEPKQLFWIIPRMGLESKQSFCIDPHLGLEPKQSFWVETRKNNLSISNKTLNNSVLTN